MIEVTDIILDTHVWIWLLNGDMKLQKSGFLSYIDKAVKYHTIKISAISLWEVSMLSAKKRIILTESTLEWINKALSVPGIIVQPITPQIACESVDLPDSFDGDPADKIIIASARALNATLLTFDKKILNYAKNGYLKAPIPHNEGQICKL